MSNKGKSKKKNDRQKIVLIVILAILIIALIGALVFLILKDRKDKKDAQTGGNAPSVSEQPSTEEESTTAPNVDYEGILKEAEITAAMYDYEGAITYVKEKLPEWNTVEAVNTFIAQCEDNKSKLVKWADNTKITHIFFHTLIQDCSVAFGSNSKDNYNQVMTTIDEFNAILQQMYDRGYVLVKLSDIASINPATGKMEYNPIYLPAGKTPFVLSQDDVCYYEYMNEDGGFAQRLIVDENGKIMNEKDNADGTKTVGAFDVAPLLDQFVEQHPDFSYHGAKGILALTGYNGILGYRTSYIGYGTEADLKSVWDELFNAGGYNSDTAVSLAKGAHYYDNPNLAEDRKKAKQVADALKAGGWEFASHTWGHMNMGGSVDSSSGRIKNDRFKRDSTWWDVEVGSIVGDTNIIIFAFGADIFNWKQYTDSNDAYMYLKSMGFDYFCNVDSSQYFVQMNESAGGDGYLRQGRRNLDGQLMFKALMYPEQHLLDDIIDVKTVFDKVRPLPVVGVEVPDWFDGTNLIKPGN